MRELNKIYNIDCLEGLKGLDDNSVDLTVTSPPYDDLRTYDETCEWNFEIFKPIAKELYRVTKNGGVLVWVIGDAAKDGSETGSSFQQALYFKELGFKLHDTMIYEKNSSTFPARLTSKRYSQIFEYMFVFVKGKKIRDDIKLIADKRNKWAGWTNWGDHSQYDVDGKLNKTSNIKPIAEFSLRTNIWRYPVSFNDRTGHPAVFPEKLAEDHILSWTNEGDVVLDPFMGSGTTAKMAMLNKRNYIGFEKNSDYYEKSLERLKKYEGKFNEDISGITANDIINEKEWLDDDGNPVTPEPDMPLTVNVKEDKDLAKKAALWRQLTGELEDYFNKQTYGILQNLKIKYESKANDKRVEKVKQEKQKTENTEFYQVEENINIPESTITVTNNSAEVNIMHPIYQPVEPLEEIPPVEPLPEKEEKEFDLKKDIQFWMPAVKPGQELMTISKEEAENINATLNEPTDTAARINKLEEAVFGQKEPVKIPLENCQEISGEELKATFKKTNKVIEKTHNEEGKYGENILWLHSINAENTTIKDVRDDSAYQHKDVDFLVNDIEVEVKSDHIACSSTYHDGKYKDTNGTRNLTFECATHVRGKTAAEDLVKQKGNFQTLTEYKEYVQKKGYPLGCNFKTESGCIVYVCCEEEHDNNRRYMLKDCISFRTNELFDYINKNFSKPEIRVCKVFQEEDGAYNIILLVNIEEMIKNGVAKRCGRILNFYKKNYPRLFEEYMTTEEQEKYLGLWKTNE